MPPAKPRRKRIDSHPQPPQWPEDDFVMRTLPDKHVMFTQWAQDRGVEMNGVKSEMLAGRGLGLVTTKRVKAGERVLFVPEKAMFQPNQKLLKKHKLIPASPQARLAISAMATLSTDSDFQWWRFVMPTYSSFEAGMPILWPESLRQHLPVPVHQPLERQEADYERDVKAVRHLFNRPDLMSRHKFDEEGFTEEDFKYWWLIVNSRSFHWKAPRGRGGEMVLCPFIDYMNHAPTGSCCKVTMLDDGYEVIADRHYDVGQEILATYGPHSNDKLLVHYGFICPIDEYYTSPDDEIRLDHIILPELGQAVKDRLQDVGFLGGYAFLPPTDEFCFKTQVAIRATFLTANEWEYFIQNGEDLGEDQTFKVEEIMYKLTQAYRRETLKTLKTLEKMDQTAMRDVLIARWTQIGLALSKFGDRKSLELKKP